MVSMKPWSETWCRQFWDVLSHGKCEVLCSYQEYGSSWTETLEPLTRPPSTTQSWNILLFLFSTLSTFIHPLPLSGQGRELDLQKATRSLLEEQEQPSFHILNIITKAELREFFSHCFCCSCFMLEGIYSAFIIFLLKNFNLTGGWVWVAITSEGRERNPSVFLRGKNGLTVIWWYILCS